MCFSSGFGPTNPAWGVPACVFVCALDLYLASPGSGVRCGCVCLGSSYSWVLPFLAETLGCVCLCARPPVPSHSWLGFVVCVSRLESRLSPRRVGVCVLVCAVRLHPAIPGWGVGVPVFVCARRLYPVNPGPGYRSLCFGSGLEFHPANAGWGVGACVYVCALRQYPASPGWGVRCPCVCLGSVFGCAPPFLAGVLGCVLLCALASCAPPFLAGVRGVCISSKCGFHAFNPGWGHRGCVFVCVLRLYSASPCWGVRCASVCAGSGLGCAPQFLARVLGCVWLFARFACTPPFLAGVRGACFSVRVSP